MKGLVCPGWPAHFLAMEVKMELRERPGCGPLAWSPGPTAGTAGYPEWDRMSGVKEGGGPPGPGKSRGAGRVGHEDSPLGAPATDELRWDPH